jgi:catecholate siderophore receptor
VQHTKNPHASALITAESRRHKLLPLGAALMAVSFNAMAQQAADAAKEKTLSTVNVQADTEAPQDGMRATVTRVGKVLQDPHDIPQAVTTVTNKIMEEQQVGSLREALRNVSGLTFNAAEGGRSGDNMMLRGFYTFGDMYLDGIRDTAQYNRETFNLEQVDVLRGAGAMLFGRGQAGGVINQVSKTPLLTDRHKVTGSVGTESYLEATGDFNKRLGETSAIRVNVMHREEGSWRSNPASGAEPEIHREGLAASLGLGISTDNEFTLSHIVTNIDDIPDYGFSFDNTTHLPNSNFSPNTFWGIDRNFDEGQTNITTATYTHRFSPGSEWRTQLRYADYERSYWARTPSATVAPGSNGLIAGSTNAGPTRAMDYETLTLQSDFNNKFKAFGMQHEFLIGAEYLYEDSFRHGLQNLGGTTALNPPVFVPYVTSTTGSPVRFNSDSYAVYAQDTIEFMPKWKATLGLRHDEMDATYSSTTSPSLQYGEMSTRAALSYHPTDETHYYLGYSDSFSPTADLYQLTTTPLPAERSHVMELGGKWLLAHGDLALRAAVYRADKEWERNTDLESTAALLSRKRHTNGIELELAGRISENWEVFAGLALMDAKIDNQNDGDALGTFATITANGTAAGPTGLAGAGYAAGEAADAAQIVYLNRSQQTSEGKRPRNTPKYTFNLWSTYKFDGAWKAGLGAETKGKRYGYGIGTCGTTTQNATTGLWTYNNCSTAAFAPNAAPAYVRWDAMVAYEQKKWGVRLNVQNLFDTVYYDSIYDNGGFSVPGTGRKVILTGEYKF